MHVLIIGAGRVGSATADLAIKSDCDVTVVDTSEEKIKRLSNVLDINGIIGDGTSSELISKISPKTVDILVVTTRDDITNIAATAVANTTLDIKKRLIRLKNREFYKNEALVKLLHIDRVIDIDKAVANRIIDLMKIAPATNVLEFFDEKAVVVGIRVKNNNPYAMKTVEEIDNEDFSVPLLYHLGNYEITTPKSKIVPGDIAFIAASVEKIDKILRDMVEDIKQIGVVSIIGGGRKGRYIAKYCIDNGIDVKIIDNNHDICNELSLEFPSAVVMFGSGSDMQLLKTEDIFSSDLLITTTKDDEMNILLSVLAKRMGVRKCITVTATEEYSYIAEQLGLGSIVDPKLSSSAAILDLIIDRKATSISVLKGSKIGIIEEPVKSSSPVINQLIEDIKFPSLCRIALLLRRDKILIPKDKEILIEGDRLVIFARFGDLKKISKLF